MKEVVLYAMVYIYSICSMCVCFAVSVPKHKLLSAVNAIVLFHIIKQTTKQTHKSSSDTLYCQG